MIRRADVALVRQLIIALRSGNAEEARRIVYAMGPEALAWVGRVLAANQAKRN